jgi:resuscitation-promoting factor RpfB
LGNILNRKLFFITLICLLLLAGCSNLLNQSKEISVHVTDGGKQTQITAASGSSVKQILDNASITLNSLDKVDPPSTTVLSSDATIIITRVKEDFVVEQAIIPFEQQTVKNESLPEGQSVLIQAGENGVQQNTWRVLYENGVETSRSIVSNEVTQPAKPEIVMIGVLSPYTPQSISGLLAYITSSNAWVMEGSTGNRRPVVSTGDLDGRIFSVSPDREWLLFSRTSSKDGEINSLWIVNLKSQNPEPIKTNITNVVNYADWIPGRSRAFSYSTVEPVPTTPGWNANNDLLIYRFDAKGNTLDSKLVVDKNSGGINGWWGTAFEWSTGGNKLAYARPDSIGLVDLESGSLTPLIEFDPYNTGSDWAWVPGIKWSPDDQAIFTTLIPGIENGTAQNPVLSAIILPEGQTIHIVTNCGLFCYPVPSSLSPDGVYTIAYLSAIVPDQSETSGYNLKIMDRDGSNPRKLYPDEGIQGLVPQYLKWSPDNATDHLLAAIAKGDLILVDTSSGSIKKITSDGSISKIDWK